MSDDYTPPEGLMDPNNVQQPVLNDFQRMVYEYLTNGQGAVHRRRKAQVILGNAGFFITSPNITSSVSKEWLTRFLARPDIEDVLLVCGEGIERFKKALDIADPPDETKSGTITITLDVERTAVAAQGFRSDLWMQSDCLERQFIERLVGMEVQTWYGRPDEPPRYTVRNVRAVSVGGPATDRDAVVKAITRNG